MHTIQAKINKSATVRRYGASFLGGSFVTLGLFSLMVHMVADPDAVMATEEPDFQFLDVIEDIKDVPPKRFEPEDLIRPEDPEVPDDIQTDPPACEFDCLPVPPIPHPPKAPNPPEDFKSNGLNDSGLMPLVRVQPDYPKRALENGIEGYVLVALTVEADGSVDKASIQILEESPSGAFGKAAIKAAQKFKFKPLVVNGNAVSVPGVTYRFTFELDK